MFRALFDVLVGMFFGVALMAAGLIAFAPILLIGLVLSGR